MTTYWAPLLHAYQPPTQDLSVLRKIDKECYKPLFSMLEEHDNVKICLNINGILIELLREFGLDDTIEQVQNLVVDQKLEILGTAKYHPILPLIPEKEAQRQILLNEEINRKEFNKWEKNGFLALNDDNFQRDWDAQRVFALSLYRMGLFYEKKGMISFAVDKFEGVKKIDPYNEELLGKIGGLKKDQRLLGITDPN